MSKIDTSKFEEYYKNFDINGKSTPLAIKYPWDMEYEVGIKPKYRLIMHDDGEWQLEPGEYSKKGKDYISALIGKDNTEED